MLRTYLIHPYVSWSIILCLALSFVAPFFFLPILLLLVTTKYLWFRKSRNRHPGSVDSGRKVFLSPVNGEIISVRKAIDHRLFGQNLTEIRILVPLFSEFGLYLPMNCELESYKPLSQKKAFLRFDFDSSKLSTKHLNQSKKVLGGLCIDFISKENAQFGLQFLRCYLGLAPRIWGRPGDRGQVGASLGYFPFGGTLLVFLPSNAVMMIEEDMKVVGGQTPLAFFK